MFPEYLLDGGKDGIRVTRVHHRERCLGKPCDTPVGFSIRRIEGVDRVSINCAACHTSTYRETPKSDPTLVLGMPAHRLNLLGYFDFLFRCAGDGRFNTGEVMARIDARTQLGPLERIIYRDRDPARASRSSSDFARRRSSCSTTRPGTGRIDTFTPYKALIFGFPDSRNFAVGNADFPSIWNQGPREGMQLHWDGNNTSVHERNISAAIGAGATPTSLDFPRLKRIEDWLRTFPAPTYPWKIDEALARKGEPLYVQHCAACHGVLKGGKFEGELRRQGRPDRPDQDRPRAARFVHPRPGRQPVHPRRGTGLAVPALPQDERLRQPAARRHLGPRPYLHNGSVPTLRDLLEPPDQAPEGLLPRLRRATTRRRSASSRPWPRKGGRHFTRFDTSVRGNGNGGHEYGTDLTAGPTRKR